MSADTFAPSYTKEAFSKVGSVAAMVEEKKLTKYSHVEQSYCFTPVAVETSSVLGPKSLAFLKELGYHIKQVTGEEKSFAYLLQCLSVTM